MRVVDFNRVVRILNSLKPEGRPVTETIMGDPDGQISDDVIEGMLVNLNKDQLAEQYGAADLFVKVTQKAYTKLLQKRAVELLQAIEIKPNEYRLVPDVEEITHSHFRVTDLSGHELLGIRLNSDDSPEVLGLAVLESNPEVQKDRFLTPPDNHIALQEFDSTAQASIQNLLERYKKERIKTTTDKFVKALSDGKWSLGEVKLYNGNTIVIPLGSLFSNQQVCFTKDSGQWQWQAGFLTNFPFGSCSNSLNYFNETLKSIDESFSGGIRLEPTLAQQQEIAQILQRSSIGNFDSYFKAKQHQ